MPKRWITYEEPDRDVAVAHWTERDIAVVFPLQWVRKQASAREMLPIANARIADIERRTGKSLVPGSVLLAFTRHAPQPVERHLNPDVRVGLLN
jgi:hypothetical protein